MAPSVFSPRLLQDRWDAYTWTISRGLAPCCQLPHLNQLPAKLPEFGGAASLHPGTHLGANGFIGKQGRPTCLCPTWPPAPSFQRQNLDPRWHLSLPCLPAEGPWRLVWHRQSVLLAGALVGLRRTSPGGPVFLQPSPAPLAPGPAAGAAELGTEGGMGCTYTLYRAAHYLLTDRPLLGGLGSQQKDSFSFFSVFKALLEQLRSFRELLETMRSPVTGKKS